MARKYSKADYFIYNDSSRRLRELDKEIAALDRQLKSLKKKQLRAKALEVAKAARSKRYWRRGYRKINRSVSGY